MMFDIFNRRRVAALEEIVFLREVQARIYRGQIAKLDARIKGIERQRREAAAKGRASQAAARARDRANALSKLPELRASMGQG